MTTDIALLIDGVPLHASKKARTEGRFTHIQALALRLRWPGGDSAVKGAGRRSPRSGWANGLPRARRPRSPMPRLSPGLAIGDMARPGENCREAARAGCEPDFCRRGDEEASRWSA